MDTAREFQRDRFRQFSDIGDLLVDARHLGFHVEITLYDDQTGHVKIDHGRPHSFRDLNDMTVTLAIEIDHVLNHRTLVNRILGRK